MIQQIFVIRDDVQPHAHCATCIVSFPDPVPKKGKGLAHFEPFLVFADSTVQDPGLPVKELGYVRIFLS